MLLSCCCYLRSSTNRYAHSMKYGFINSAIICRFEKSIIQRAIEYVKDRTEVFDDYYPCRKSIVVDCNIVHVYRWITLFIFLHNLSKSQSEINILKFLIRKGEKIP